MKSKVKSVVGYRCEGRPTLWSAPAGADITDRNNWRLLYSGKNTICVGMYESLFHLMRRDFDDWQPASIALGYGGDYSQTSVPADIGSRVAPAYTDDSVRKSYYVAPIVEVKEDPVITEKKVHYIAIVRPESGNTDPDDVSVPYLNEFGLLANNGTLLAHYITAADGVTGRAIQYAKSELEWLIIDWEIELIGVEP